ncbi:MAG TPA: DNA repair protein RecN [Bdellovibrionales bacterium]|nr:DNA repair protein RecN [Bdellovibrionales bacterium]
MLLELRVSNFAIIDNVHIQFRSGLNILSGETGAGKSILLKSLGLLMGDKAAPESVRQGAEQALIEGSFDLSDRADIRERLTAMGIEATEDQMIVRRIVSGGTKSRVYINGALSTLAALREVVSPMVEMTGAAVPLIEMTGQHENRNLLSRAYHLDLLDQYAGLLKARNAFNGLFQRRQHLIVEIEGIKQESRSRAQRLDFLVYQREEIRALDLAPGEEETIENETRRLKHSAKLSDFAQQAENLLFNDDDSVTSRLHYLIQRASELKSADPSLAQRLEPLSQARTLINEVSYELRDYEKSLDADPARQQELEGRLSSLRTLQKKYGATAAEILDALAGIETEIEQLENSDERLSQAEKELAVLEKQLRDQSADFHKRRVAAAKLLADGVNDELKDLNMKGLALVVQVEATAELTSTGMSAVEFLTLNSKADIPRPLAKVASGGEMSRILLAIKQVVGAGQFPRTYLFDEVDTGVSGPTAEKVGRKLKRIAQGQQVICVTHLPQVASFGDAHFAIQKNASGKGAMQTAVTELKSAKRIEEIARLISGEKITKTSLAHAEQLLSDSQAH